MWNYLLENNLNKMKKLMAFLFGLMLSSSIQAAGLPTTTDVNFNVINISMDNQDALSVGARPGDILRFELAIQSDTEDVMNYVARMDIASVLENTEIVDTGLAEIQGNEIVFPPFSHAAPCQHIFVFFARVKDCAAEGLNITAGGEGQNVMVPVQCAAEPAPLVPTGAPTWMTIVLAFAGVLMGGLFFVGRYRA